MKHVLYKLYVIAFMFLTIGFIIVIWNVTFHHIIEEYEQRKALKEVTDIKEKRKREAEKTKFERIILESDERVKHYLGYRVIEEQRIEGHFHHIGFDIGPDNRSYCIKCHGDMPHDHVKELRAFLNMHAFFIACQTCHVKLEGSSPRVYKWYDRKTGELVPSPVLRNNAGSYNAKIIQIDINKMGEEQRVDSQDRIDFVKELKDREKELTEAQKSKAKKMIHEIVTKQPYICEDCHQKESPLLPLLELGYPRDRIDSILSTEVVGMIKKYTEFYMPRMLHPGEQVKEQERKQEGRM
ncbi:MAG: cytochrome C [Nitrospirae bacterium]|nr:cytochrome C [Nitrospirota bacterium]